MSGRLRRLKPLHTLSFLQYKPAHTHTHTFSTQSQLYIYIYIYILFSFTPPYGRIIVDLFIRSSSSSPFFPLCTLSYMLLAFFSSILFFLSILCIFCKFTYAFSPPFTIFFFFPYVYVLLSHLSFFPLRAVAMAEGFHDVHPYSKRPHIEPRHCKNNKNTHTQKQSHSQQLALHLLLSLFLFVSTTVLRYVYVLRITMIGSVEELKV